MPRLTPRLKPGECGGEELFKNENGESSGDDREKEAGEWAKEATNVWIKEAEETYEKRCDDIYDYTWAEACIESVQSGKMSKYVEEWGVDKRKWGSSDETGRKDERGKETTSGWSAKSWLTTAQERARS